MIWECSVEGLYFYVTTEAPVIAAPSLINMELKDLERWKGQATEIGKGMEEG